MPDCIRSKLDARAKVLGCLLALLIGGNPLAAMAQFSTPFNGQNDQPIGISADEDIEWNREQRYYIARGNAQASQGEVFISADTLQAFYRETGGAGGQAAATGSGAGSGAASLFGGATAGSTQIFKLVANGNVYAKSGEDILTGDRLEYFIEEERAVITGNLIILATNQGAVSAKQRITYDGKQLFAVAEGDAQVVQDDNIVGAEKITAFFYADGQQGSQSTVIGLGGTTQGSGRIRRIEATGQVELTDGNTYARANDATYDPSAQMAILTGNVVVTQGANQLVGNYAEYNFISGEANVKAKENGRTFILIDPQTGAIRQGQP